MTLSRGNRIALFATLALLGVSAALVILILSFDWNRARPWLNAKVSDATGRSFAINGDLSLRWVRAQEAGAGWRGWLPWPRLTARDISIANPDWATADRHTAAIGQIDFAISPLALLGKRILIPTLSLDAPFVSLQRRADGSNNWFYKQSDTPSEWKLDVRELVLKEGKVHLKDDLRRADVTAQIVTLDQASPQGYGIGWKLGGTVNREKLSGSGKAGAVLSLQNQGKPYPIEADVRIGSTSISLAGTLTRPTELAALDMRLKLAGVSLAQLYRVSGIVLPETPPYSTTGRLTGRLGAGVSDWTYENFSGKVGGSDLAGTLRYEDRAPRPQLSGAVVSKLLQFSDLAPIIGADGGAERARRGAAVAQPSARLLPVEEFNAAKWNEIDADVRFTGEKIIKDAALPITKLDTHLIMKDGVLNMAPLSFGVAGGTLTSVIRLDGRQKLIRAEMKIAARKLKLRQLFPTVKDMQQSLGDASADLSLSGTGNSVAAMLGGASGEVKAVVSDGTISKFLLEAVGLNVGSMVLTKIVGDRQVKINCLASDFAVSSGLMQTRSFVIDTEESLVDVSGRINLATEKLDLRIDPHTKGARLISLRAPLYVKGSFIDPDVSVDKGVLALKAGSAVALAILAPMATALLPLANMGGSEESNCAKLLADASEKPQAPPPGQKLRASRQAPAAHVSGERAIN
ncbi:MAG: AsmA family protein [Noviherbaspirillum sp.]